MAKKLYFKIGEACKRLDIQPYVLRYWETEFPALSPDKSKSGQRVYSREDLAIIRRIKELLYDEGYTIAGAKKKLEGELESGGLSAKADGEEQPEAEAEAKPASRAEKAKSKAGSKAKPEPGAAEPAPLDSGPSDAKMLREGIRDALKEARAILAILDSKSPAD